jgi:hypothetical protein
MKTVFDNAQTAHVWAQQSQPRGRSGNGNLSFEGDTLFSYRTPIARIATVNGKRVALITSERYSITTSGKHMPAACRAVSHMPTFYVPHLGDDAIGVNLRVLVENYEAAKMRIRRAREFRYISYAEFLKGAAEQAVEYARTFGLPDPGLDPEGDADEIMKFRTEREARLNTPQALAKRERERERREARKAEAEERKERERHEREREQRTRWLAGENVHVYHLSDERGGALLRVKDETLQTSWGANVPLDHARRVFRLIKQCKDAGQEYRRNGHSIHVGHFTVDHISADGDLRVGCHRINWQEIERVARLVGELPSEQAA